MCGNVHEHVSAGTPWRGGQRPGRRDAGFSEAVTSRAMMHDGSPMFDKLRIRRNRAIL